MSLVLRSTVQRFLFSYSEEGSYNQNVCVFKKKTFTLWYFLTEYHLISYQLTHPWQFSIKHSFWNSDPLFVRKSQLFGLQCEEIVESSKLVKKVIKFA